MEQCTMHFACGLTGNLSLSIPHLSHILLQVFIWAVFLTAYITTFSIPPLCSAHTVSVYHFGTFLGDSIHCPPFDSLPLQASFQPSLAERPIGG